MLIFLALLLSIGVVSASAREEEPAFHDIALYMDENIYDAQIDFPGAEVVPARGFSLFMQLGDVNEDGFAEAGMTAYSDTGIIRSVQVHKNDDEYNIFGIYYGTDLVDAVDILLDCHYELKSSEMLEDGSFSDVYNSYMDLYSLYLEADTEAKVTSLFLTKNP